jgi:zinc/manganese transport system substrate-binding protein
MRRDLVLILQVVLALVACTPPPADAGGDRLRVVATTTQVGEAARVVGGDAIELTVLLPPGAEAHDFEITPDAAAAIERADLILKSGAGLESWLDDALTTIGGEERVRDMSSGIELRAVADGHEGEPNDAHEGEAIDPHYWLNAPNATALVENVRAALAEAVPDASDQLASRARQYTERLAAADAEIRELLGQLPADRRGVVTNHDALGYFLDEYGLRLVGTVFGSLDVAAEPDPGQLAELVETIRSEGVTAIFSESAVNPGLARVIAKETGARVAEEPLYTDSLGPPGSGADTLDGMLLHNARVLFEGLGGR